MFNYWSGSNYNSEKFWEILNVTNTKLTWCDVDPPGVLAKELAASVVVCDVCDVDDRTQRDGWSCERSEEVLSAKRDLRDGVEGPAWPEGASAPLPPEIGAKTEISIKQDENETFTEI
jgi:hypothetical protein